MISQVRPAFSMLLIFTVITGVVYPLVVTGVAQMVFPHQANGSLIVIDGKANGSELIGQQFDAPKYFWGRLSATGAFPYNANLFLRVELWATESCAYRDGPGAGGRAKSG